MSRTTPGSSLGLVSLSRYSRTLDFSIGRPPSPTGDRKWSALTNGPTAAKKARSHENRRKAARPGITLPALSILKDEP